MPDPSCHNDSDGNAADVPLWRELADGSAGPGVKAAVSVGLMPLFVGLGLLGAFVAAGAFPELGWRRGPEEEVVAGALAVAALLYLLAVTWIWTRRGRQQLGPLWRAALHTVLIGLATLAVGVFLELNIGSPAEVLIAAVVFLGIGAVVLAWVQGARRFARARPPGNRLDGVLDVRCPSCGYRMVGLHESRCPECGTAYTLDELLGRQAFLTPAQRRASPGPTQPGHGAQNGMSSSVQSSPERALR